MDVIMSMQAAGQARLEWACRMAGAVGDPELPPWTRPLACGADAEHDPSAVAALRDECWHRGCVCEGEAFLMHAASAAELGCPGFCGLPSESWKGAV